MFMFKFCPINDGKVEFDFPEQHQESKNLFRSSIEAPGRQLPLAEPPSEQVSVHLVQLAGECQETSAAINLTDSREKITEVLDEKDFNTRHHSRGL